MTTPASRLTEEFQFGDLIENTCASENNPTRFGYFVRKGNRTGKLNRGPYIELTDKKGRFWTQTLTGERYLRKIDETTFVKNLTGKE